MGREWLFSLIPLTLGVAFLGVGGYGLRRAGLLRRKGVIAAGRIVRHEVSKGDEGAIYHHPVAAWTARDGRAHEYASRFGRGSVAHAYRVGAGVKVRYDPDRPSRFEVVGWDSRVVDLLFTVLGSIFTVGTVIVVLVRLLTL
ncbi:DUF3592 domain-containing protein [Streptomyces sp. WM6368]|uniref:DUF3592 domain-containing protein n=1 Tax=Streptomyces sp. WM6368 TaxID=1415554 RepID=UPI0006ADAC25|nr:DUF3592 domain-containing protein [Streptomyces sp. WM6368]KOU19953.1 hypothetical protein ADK51_25745 [Streptomyces sp. WM6368]